MAKLKDGELSARIEHLGIDAGSITANVSTDVHDDEPTFQRHISSNGLDIGKLTSLMGQSVPLSGALTIDTGWARPLPLRMVSRKPTTSSLSARCQASFQATGYAANSADSYLLRRAVQFRSMVLSDFLPSPISQF
ncbi:hypothetical protein EHS39_29295 [Ensifer sp. MPMI2T]|nr:hypothetical protein EHS39_29295 [Ensifer sp. MPMI2T]